MWHGNYAWSAWPMFTGGLLFWGSLISLVAWGFHRTTRRSEGSAIYGKSSLEHAKERHANGEITTEQFDEIKRNLVR